MASIWSAVTAKVTLGGLDVTDRISAGGVQISQWGEGGSQAVTPGVCRLTLDSSDGGVPVPTPEDTLLVVSLSDQDSPAKQSWSFDGGLVARPTPITTAPLHREEPRGEVYRWTGPYLRKYEIAPLLVNHVQPGTAHDWVYWNVDGALSQPPQRSAIAGDIWKVTVGAAAEPSTESLWVQYQPGASTSVSTGGVPLPANWVQYTPQAAPLAVGSYYESQYGANDFHDEVQFSVVRGDAWHGDAALKITFLTDRSADTPENNRLTRFKFRLPLNTSMLAARTTATGGYFATTAKSSVEWTAVPGFYYGLLPCDNFSGMTLQGAPGISWRSDVWGSYKKVGAHQGDNPYYPYFEPAPCFIEVDDEGYFCPVLLLSRWTSDLVIYLDAFEIEYTTYGAEPTVPHTLGAYVDQFPPTVSTSPNPNLLFTGTVKDSIYDWSLDVAQDVNVTAQDTLALLGSSKIPNFLQAAVEASGDYQLNGYWPLTGKSLPEVCLGVSGRCAKVLRPDVLETQVSYDEDNVDGSGKALTFTAASTTTELNLHGYNQGAILLWFRTTGTGVLAEVNFGTAWIRAEINASGMVQLDSTEDTPEATTVKGNDNGWHFLLMFWDSDATDTWRMYVDHPDNLVSVTYSYSSGIAIVGSAGFYTTNDPGPRPLHISHMAFFFYLTAGQAAIVAEACSAVVPGYAELAGAAIERVADMASTQTSGRSIDTGVMPVQPSALENTSHLNALEAIAATEQGSRVFVDGADRLVFRGASFIPTAPLVIPLSVLDSPPQIEWTAALVAETGMIVDAAWPEGRTTVDLGLNRRHRTSLSTLCQDQVDTWLAAAQRIRIGYPARPMVKEIVFTARNATDLTMLQSILALLPGDRVELTGLPTNMPISIVTQYATEGREIRLSADGITVLLKLSSYQETDEFTLGVDNLSGVYGTRL